MSVVPSLPHTEETGPPRPPPEPPPGVSTAPPRRTTSSRSASPCPIDGRLFSSVHHMKVHSRRVHPGTPIVESLKCVFATAPRSSKQVTYAQVTTENAKRINEQKTDNATLQAPMKTMALQPLLCCNPTSR
ncbi:hypothetical protein TcCL_ESM04453 [Trypanosoma cruzi]|nr:hypothetical protein TcCL_ESM04453 [Trypanosoma cruzi]